MDERQSSKLTAVVREIICEHDGPVCPKCDLNSAEIEELREVGNAQADNGDPNRQSYLNRALKIIDELTSQYDLWLKEQAENWDHYYKLLNENKALKAKLEDLEQLVQDKKDAAGELLIEVPEPGTPMSKLMIANSLLRQRAGLAEHKVYRIEVYLERLQATIGNYFKIEHPKD